MRERRFVCLAVPQASARQVRAIRGINHGGTLPVSEWSPAQIRDVGNELIETRIKEIDELQLENGALSVRGQAAGDSENGRFSKGRIKDLVRKLGRELLRETEHATFWIFNVLAEENSSRIFLQARAQGFVHRIANPIFPGRQDFFVDLWRRFGDVREKLVGRGVLGLFGLAVFATNALLNFVVELRKFFCGNNAFLDQLILPAFKRIEFFELPQFFLPAIEFLIVRTGVTGEPLHLDPEKERPAAGADLVERFGCRVINLLHILSIDLAPVLWIENTQRQGVRFACGHADAVRVIFDKKEQRQFLLFGETDRFKKISLPSGGVTHCGHDQIFFAVELNAPGDPASGKQLRTGRRGHTPDVQVRIAVMRRHLAPTAPGVSLGEIFESQLARRHAASEHESAVAIIRNDVIAGFHLHGDCRQRLVTHSGNVKMSLALPI